MEQDKRKEEDERTKALDKLVDRILNTPIENLSEMTDMPLNLVEPIAGMIMIDDLVHFLTNRIKENASIAEGKNVKRKPIILMSESWQRATFRLRRSINADGLVRATDLAKEHMATRPYEEDKDAFQWGTPQ